MGKIILGVTGSIAAFKSASLCTSFRKAGHAVRVVMTQGAQHFITPTTLRALSGEPVVTDMWIEESHASLVHISLAEWADVLLIAPATANIIAKLWAGIADEILSCTALACPCPIIVAPAMNDQMWNNPATQRNVRELGERGIRFVGPEEGRLASGKLSIGRLCPLDDIIEAVEQTLRGGP